MEDCVREICQSDRRDLESFKRELCIKYKVNFFSNEEIRTVYRNMISQGKITPSSHFDSLVRVKGTRNKQGVIVITVLMSPYPNGQEFSCQFDCHYCPKVPNYPRSYYPDEPAVNRGRENNWDPVKQVVDRLDTYKNNGIISGVPGDQAYKADIIIAGGTYTSYPRDYREQFILSLYYACNTYFTAHRDVKTLEEEQSINETANVRIIGLSIETRPDTICKPVITELRKLGVTRVQLGIQHLDDVILDKINRKHKVKHSKRAIKFLLDNCFKVTLHFMPDLPGSNFARDLEMWKELFTDPDLEWDYCKVYPCMTMPYTEIAEWYHQANYQPYADELIDIRIGGKIKKLSKIVVVCMEFMLWCKWHQRVERMQRDLPVHEAEAGSRTTNLRQYVIDNIEANNGTIREIRYREVRSKVIDYSDVEEFIEIYPASGGTEYFISIDTPDRKNLIGFIRLRIPDESESNRCIPELKGAALIRELHIYGEAQTVGSDTLVSAQHRGFGSKLLSRAEDIAKEAGYSKIAVISGVGVKGYYKKKGFEDSQYYMFKKLQ